MSSEQDSSPRGRAGIIQAVQTPLGFITLAVLIIEAILGILASRATGWDYSFLLWAMIALLFGLVLCVVVVIIRHPEMLLGAEATARENARILNEQLRAASDEVAALRRAAESSASVAARYKAENAQLNSANAELSARLAHVDSLKNRVWALLHDSDSVALPSIFELLGAANDQSIRNDILSALGILIDEGRVARHPVSSGYYRAVRK